MGEYQNPDSKKEIQIPEIFHQMGWDKNVKVLGDEEINEAIEHEHITTLDPSVAVAVTDLFSEDTCREWQTVAEERVARRLVALQLKNMPQITNGEV